jgi:uncharacterized protein YbaP (TraB family)
VKKLLALLFVVFLFTPVRADTVATPALWHVQGREGDVYLLGSVHILPPQVQWRSPAIRAAIGRADIFVFEVPQDDRTIAQLQRLIAAKGYLPAGQSLRQQVRPALRPDYDAALAASGLPPSGVDRMRPWLAGLQIMFAQIAKQNFSVDNGVDRQLAAEAAKAGKPIRYLETIEEQFALLAPDDRALEMEEFEAGLKDLRDVIATVQPLVDAWSKGDVQALDEMINGELEKFPAARKALLDDRNQAWLPKIRAMLGEKRTTFIAVGAGHLTGARGLPALLRKDGYKVDGP